MEARILRVKLHQKLTSIISVALKKEAWRQRKDYFNINSVILRKGCLKEEKTLNQLTNSPAYQNKKIKNVLYA